ncbi:MAG TPA: hypothetical protein VIL12_06395 [Acidimicrobiia bacterium]
MTIEVNNQSFWQRPSGLMAAFAGSFVGREVHVLIFDEVGDLLSESSGRVG